MAAADILQIVQASLILLLVVSGPLLVASLLTGVVIGLFQALTQIQEMTLTFVPKLMVMGVVFVMCLPAIGQAMANFMAVMSDHIVHG